MSSRLLEEQKKPLMGAAALEIGLTVADLEAAASARADGGEQSFWSDAGRPLKKRGADGPSLATFEPGRLRADGKQRIAGAHPGAEGWVSRVLSDEKGCFAVPPALTLSFPQPASVPGLTFVFDPGEQEWCSGLRVLALRAGKIVTDRTLHPDGPTYCDSRPISQFDQLRLEFLSTARPLRRARLAELVLGQRLLFDAGSIVSAQRKAAADPICRRLPSGSLSWEAVNLPQRSAQGFYDPEEPGGLWQFAERRSPISLRMGQQLTDGSGEWEWLSGGEYYLTGKPKTSDLTVRFEATDALGLLDRPFSRGRWDGREHSLYELALSVLEDSDLVRMWPGQTPWQLWEGLKTITTNAPLPVRPARDCLQLIAHAACCVLFCDRQGRVCIRPAAEESTGLRLTLRDQLGEGARAEKNPVLAAVSCPVMRYTPEESDSQLHKGVYSVSGELPLHLEYRPAAKIRTDCTGGRIKSMNISTAACDLVLEGEGSVELTLTGRLLKASQTTFTWHSPVQDAAGQGEVLKNPLITHRENAEAVALWVGAELCRRTVYHCTGRGHLQLDPMDRLTIDTRRAEQQEARLLESRLRLSAGSLSEQLVLKRGQEQEVSFRVV